MAVVILTVMAVVVDAGRLYAVQNKAQGATDSAIMGAVATSSTTPFDEEFMRLFNAGYPTSYMGSFISDYQSTHVVNQADEVFSVQFKVNVPTLIVGLLGHNTTRFNIFSQVKRGFTEVRLELALALDNTGSMASGMPTGGTKMDALKQASHDLINILFGSADTSNNIRISVLPYDVDVNIGPDHQNWVQSAHVSDYINTGGGVNGFVSNRNHDDPPNGYSDFNDHAPDGESHKFRTPYHAPHVSCNDTETTSLVKAAFGINSKSVLHSKIDTMTPSGCTRINVGLMWGWFTLSPNWQGLFDAGLPDFPDDYEPGVLLKDLVLMTDGLNTVFMGAQGASNDNDTTAALCTAIKAQGIKIYTVGFGSGVNQTLLQNCASIPEGGGAPYYFYAPTSEELQTAFHAIADDILYDTLRLSQ